jgi:hypothetical protein
MKGCAYDVDRLSDHRVNRPRSSKSAGKTKTAPLHLLLRLTLLVLQRPRTASPARPYKRRRSSLSLVALN